MGFYKFLQIRDFVTWKVMDTSSLPIELKKKIMLEALVWLLE